MSRKPDIRQLSLLDWEPPVIVTAYDPAQVRGNTYEFSLCRAISVTLTECGRTRPEIASEMSDILGKTVTVNMLNAYASGQREDHQISVPRFNALIGATGDMRLVEFLAAPRGWAVIERRYLKAIELAAVTERKKELTRMEMGLRRQMGGRF